MRPFGRLSGHRNDVSPPSSCPSQLPLAPWHQLIGTDQCHVGDRARKTSTRGIAIPNVGAHFYGGARTGDR